MSSSNSSHFAPSSAGTGSISGNTATAVAITTVPASLSLSSVLSNRSTNEIAAQAVQLGLSNTRATILNASVTTSSNSNAPTTNTSNSCSSTSGHDVNTVLRPATTASNSNAPTTNTSISSSSTSGHDVNTVLRPTTTASNSNAPTNNTSISSSSTSGHDVNTVLRPTTTASNSNAPINNTSISSSSTSGHDVNSISPVLRAVQFETENDLTSQEQNNNANDDEANANDEHNNDEDEQADIATPAIIEELSVLTALQKNGINNYCKSKIDVITRNKKFARKIHSLNINAVINM
jgi:hypothetical protein